MTMSIISHPTLGRVLGKRLGKVTQFLGIKYGDIEQRFGPPSLHEPRVAGNRDILDATSYRWVIENFDIF